MMENKTYLKAEELALDESFVQYAVHKNDPDNYWKNFINQNPQLTSEFEKAFELVGILSKAKKAEINANTLTELTSLNQRIDQQIHRKNTQLIWLKYAAIMLVLLAIGALVQSDFFRFKTYTTGQDNLHFVLTDQSKIELRKGSTIKISRFYGFTNRKIILQGEAFFNVIHSKQKTFEVTTQKEQSRYWNAIPGKYRFHADHRFG
jgi:ferric-dicitrate binding protein FerR (iron transport regulator)